MARAFSRGKFTPQHPEKYDGDASNIVYRSSWERLLMLKFDRNPNVLSWSSEEIVIPYFWSGDMKNHRYFVDFKVTFKTIQGKTKTCLIEVKPFKETQKPIKRKRQTQKSFIIEIATYSKNCAKWKAANEVCENMGWEFLKFTEYEIFKNGKPIG